tara:strand:+ start:58 stop:465 length:408 start_codon:yes stop_codon:yes gene_type:complete
MKTFAIACLLAITSALQIEQLNAVEPQFFNDRADNEYMTKVFAKWSTLGVDGADDTNAKRVLTRDNAERAAKEIAITWKGMDREAAETFSEEKIKGAWHNIDASDPAFIDQRNAYTLIRQMFGEDNVPSFSGSKK